VINKALEVCDWNVSKAARYLSISRQTLIYRMKKHRLGGPDSRAKSSGVYPLFPKSAAGVNDSRS
jgi:hypothetical protein